MKFVYLDEYELLARPRVAGFYKLKTLLKAKSLLLFLSYGLLVWHRNWNWRSSVSGPNPIRFLHRHPRSLLLPIDITSHEKVWINWTRCESNGPNLDNTHRGFLIFICDLRGEKRNYKSVAKEISKPPFFGSWSPVGIKVCRVYSIHSL